MEAAMRPDRADRSQHDQGQGQQGHPGLEGGVVVDHLEGHRKQEESATQAGIDDEGHRVGHRELPVGEEIEREHGRGRSVLDHHEGNARRPDPTTSVARTPGEVHPCDGPSIRVKVIEPSDTVARKAPATSIRPVAEGSLDSGTWRADTSRTATPRGTLMRKIHRHEAAAIR